jgi:hypothetical protein
MSLLTIDDIQSLILGSHMNISDKSITDGISRVNTILQFWLQQAAKVFKKTSQIMPF